MAHMWTVLVVLGMVGVDRSLASKPDGNKRLVLEMDLETEILNLKNKIQVMETKMTQLSQERGSVYVRWGRNVCPNTSDFIYKGYTSGKHYSQKGSGTNILCLPDDPTWSHYLDGDNSWRGRLYGLELDVHDSEHIFNDAVYNEDIPCAVCQSKKSATMMIPGRNSCYGNWTTEYLGYLMSAHYDHYSTSFVCVDGRPEFIPGGAGNDNEAILHLVEGRCGALQCPPYVEGRELACVVCSK